MLFTVEEFSQWIGLTQFEMLIQTIGLLVFTGLLTYRVDFLKQSDFNTSDTWITFFPLFVANIINAYFCVIVFIRTCLERTFKSAFLRALWSSTVIGILMLFEYMLCQKLTGANNLDTSEVASPILLLLQLLAVRACQIQ